MNKQLIAETTTTNIFYIKDERLSFYINIPKNISNIDILINILDDPNIINPSINTNEIIKEEINKIYSSPNGISIVTPLIDNNITEQLKLNNNEQVFNYADKYISYLINQAYSLLTSENFPVNKIIKLNNNKQYDVFNNWFVNKYNGRVELANYSNMESTNENIPNEEPISEEKNIANEVLENTSTIETINENEVLPEENVREPGFVSYVLLGVVVAVISLVILYMLL